MTGTAQIRPLDVGDVKRVAALHGQLLDMEFLSRYGPAFLRTYYRAWLEAPEAIALVAVDKHGDVVGALLGAVDPAVHVRAMVLRHGVRLGARIAANALLHPTVARDMVATRGIRYTRGLGRVVTGRFRAPIASPSDNKTDLSVAVLTHLMVRPEWQGSGIGRELVGAAVSMARAGGRDDMVLVTPPDLAARGFYERLGWIADGEMTSKSGEPFVRYRFVLRPSEVAMDNAVLPVTVTSVDGALPSSRTAKVGGATAVDRGASDSAASGPPLSSGPAPQDDKDGNAE